MAEEMPSSAGESLLLERKWYLANRSALLGTHGGRYIVVYNQQVFGGYDTFVEAYEAGATKYGAVPFLLQHVVDPEPVAHVSGFVVN